MKKKITSILLVAVMLSSMAPLALADEASFKKDLTDSITSASSKYHANSEQNNAISPAKPIEVATDIATKEASDTNYSQNVSVTFDPSTGTRKFDFEAVMDMSTVRDEFSTYMELAEKVAIPKGEAATLEALPVTGQFAISITYPTAASGLNAPAALLTNTGMVDFKQKKNDTTEVPISVFEETVPRTTVTAANGLTATTTITVDVKSDVTAKSLKDNLDTALADIYLYANGGELTKTGTFTVVGTTTGYIKVGASPVAYIEFKAVQDQTKEPGVEVIDETIIAAYPSSGSMGTPRPSNKKITITFIDGDKVHLSTDATLEDGKHVVDFSTIANPNAKKNKIFDGWYKDKACTQKTLDKETVTKSTSYYAGYIDTKFNIQFNVDGKPASVNTGVPGSVIVDKDMIVDKGDGVDVKLGEITVKGAKITGWFLDEALTIPAGDSVFVTEDTIFYAVTEEIKVPTQFESEGDHFAYVIGYPEGDVRPENNITREEVATIFFRLLTDEARNTNLTAVNSFADVAADRWSNRAISTMAALNVITGYEDGTFKPGKNITRAEFAAVASRFYDDDEITGGHLTDISGHWAESYIKKAVGLQWINGYEDNTFKPENNITRAEVMAIVNRMLKRDVSSDYIHAAANTWSDNPKSAWYYDDVIEATNSHKYARLTENGVEERWTEMLENRDWTTFEK